MYACHAQTLEDFRTQARRLWAAQVSPEQVFWYEETPPLMAIPLPGLATISNASLHVPRSFIDLARSVSCHQSPQRFALLYQALWELKTTTPHLLKNPAHPLTRQLMVMRQQVGRDIHKMHAFVRFQEVKTPNGSLWLAWHRPDHRILRLAAPFFQERFASLNWGIATPEESCSWIHPHLVFGPGLPNLALPTADPIATLWQTYYRHIFNPARVKERMMVREMPRRYWATLPETAQIDELLANAPARVSQMQQAAIAAPGPASAKAERILARQLEKTPPQKSANA
jgi:probable DNA metabolism protein